MKQNKLICISIYLLILFFSITSLVIALHTSVKPGYKQVTDIGGSNSKDGIEVSKTIEETDLENYFDITLTVKTQSKIDEIIKAQDIAVVIVMDISNTMATNTMKESNTKRIDEAKTAAQNFITKFQLESSSEAAISAKRQIGFVTFATNSYQVFPLSDCKTTTQKDEMNSKINNIVTQTGDYRFTNMEAGLSLAKNMLNNSAIKNKYIIFLTDGLPTTYSKTKGGYTGYNPQDPSLRPSTVPTSATPGVFYNFNTSKYIAAVLNTNWTGTNYSDYGARRAEELANDIIKENISIFTIGVGIENQPSLYHLRYNMTAETFDTDYENNNYAYYKNRYYAVTPGLLSPLEKADEDSTIKQEYDNNCSSYYKKWLKEYMSSGSGYYYDSSQSGDILNAYDKIFEGIKEITESSAKATWVTEDPMGVDNTTNTIEFVGFFDDTNESKNLKNSLTNGQENESNTVTISVNKIKWDLKNSTYIEENNNSITTYFYLLKYRIRLINELNIFKTTNIYQTNGVTTLTYVTRNNGVLSRNKTIDFPIPSVVGYLGTLSFTKKSEAFSNIPEMSLANAEFNLTHSKECPCLNHDKTNDKHLDTTKSYKAISDDNGQVTFTNIPSGHKYQLQETKSPTNYELSNTIYDIEVSYGNTSNLPNNNIIKNSIKKGNLKITKQVEGNNSSLGEFEFKINIYYLDKELTGTYEYTKYDSYTKKEIKGTIQLPNTFKLKDNDYIIIKSLPVSSTYKIEELTTEGFIVKHSFNNDNRINSNVANCQKSTCLIKNNTTQVINFYNITSYILPATGNSGMLILLIIASICIIGPIINIGYMFYKSRKEVNFTSVLRE